MKKVVQLVKWSVCSVMWFLCLALPLAHASEEAESEGRLSPVGYWKTIDDITGKPTSILHIYESKGLLYGQIVRIFPKTGYDQNELCTACKGTKHNQRMVGMVIMEGLKPSADLALQWGNGHILDPENGNIYRCRLALSNTGEKLKIRGYIGIPLFGRSQTWVKEA